DIAVQRRGKARNIEVLVIAERICHGYGISRQCPCGDIQMARDKSTSPVKEQYARFRIDSRCVRKGETCHIFVVERSKKYALVFGAAKRKKKKLAAIRQKLWLPVSAVMGNIQLRDLERRLSS